MESHSVTHSFIKEIYIQIFSGRLCSTSVWIYELIATSYVNNNDKALWLLPPYIHHLPLVIIFHIPRLMMDTMRV